MAARPAALTRPFVVLAAMTLAMHVISRTTGSGWLVVVVSGLLAVLGLSAVLPALALARMGVEVQAPTDATAGTAVAITITARVRTSPGKLRLDAPASGWVFLQGPSTGSVNAIPARRGVFEHVDVEVRSAAPFGLVWWRRRMRVRLARPFGVGPAPLDGSATPPPLTEGGADALMRVWLSPELVRGLRDYTPGDPRRMVSWVATARHGRLMVKELEEAAAPVQLTLVVDLRGDDDSAEVAASQAAGLATTALRAGAEVVLATAEVGGPRLGAVASALQVSRRLARATADGAPAAPSTGCSVYVVRAAGG